MRLRSQTVVGERPAQAGPETFFGVLRSELDTPDVLPEPFALLAAASEAVIAAFQGRRIDELNAAKVLSALRITGADGATWAPGATSGRWYRRIGDGPWLPKPPDAFHADETAAKSVQAALRAALAALSDPVAPSPATASAEPSHAPAEPGEQFDDTDPWAGTFS